jgi:hypothetical protein
MTALLQLIKCGQSYWLDNLTRRKITSGELTKRVVLQGLRGVTSNPAIFDKAISGGDDYDAQLQQLVHAGCEVHEIYERLVISDIQDACDILRPVYDVPDGEDGFVSLACMPKRPIWRNCLSSVRWSIGPLIRRRGQSAVILLPTPASGSVLMVPCRLPLRRGSSIACGWGSTKMKF